DHPAAEQHLGVLPVQAAGAGGDERGEVDGRDGAGGEVGDDEVPVALGDVELTARPADDEAALGLPGRGVDLDDAAVLVGQPGLAVGQVDDGARDAVADERPDDDHRAGRRDTGLDDAALTAGPPRQAAPRVGDPPHHDSPSAALADSTWTTW